MEAAVVEVGFVGIAAEDAFEIGADPVVEVVVFAAKLPVEEDVSVEAFVEPEATASGGAGFIGIEVAGFGFVRSQVSTLEHVLLHECNEDAALVGDEAGSVAHGLFGEVNPVTVLVELHLAIIREVVEETVAKNFGDEVTFPEAVLDDGGRGLGDDGFAFNGVAFGNPRAHPATSSWFPMI